MATASDEFLIKLRYWLVSGGMMTRIACGTTTSRSIVPRPQAERLRRLGLAVRHGQHAGAHHLGNEGGGIERQRQNQRGEFRQDFDAAHDIEAAHVRKAEGQRRAGQYEHGELANRRSKPTRAK